MRIPWRLLPILLVVGCFADQPGNVGAPAPPKSQSHQTGDAEPPIHAVCTVGMVADLVQNIGQDRVKVTTLMGPGVDPHRYKITPGDVRRMRTADIIFFSGLHLEGKLGAVLEHMAKSRPCVGVAESIPKSKLLTEEDDEGVPDPHVWFDVSLWRYSLKAAYQKLCEFEPASTAMFTKNYRRYDCLLANLDTEVREMLATVPLEKRALVTAHDAFRYFGRAYQIDVRGIQGISTEDEAGVKHINELVDFVTKRKIPAVFVESSVPMRNIQALMEGAKARGHQLKLGGELFSDSMGDDGSPEGTYIGMVRANVVTIVEALNEK